MTQRITAFAFTLFLLLTAVALSADAQTTRVYVAASGDDANACTVKSPCQTIMKALSVVDARGEVLITENGDYDQFIITKPVTVTGAPGINANIIPDDGGVAIITSKYLTPSDPVTIRNLNIKSTINPGTASGILNQSAGALYVDGCTITGMLEGIGSKANGHVFVHDTTIRDCSVAVHSNGSLAEGIVRLTVDHCHIEQNTYGVYIDPKVILTVRDSVLSANSTAAIYIFSNKSGLFDDVTVDNCLIWNHKLALILRVENDRKSQIAQIGTISHEIRVVSIARLTQRQVRILTAIIGAITTLLLIIETLYRIRFIH